MTGPRVDGRAMTESEKAGALCELKELLKEINTPGYTIPTEPKYLVRYLNCSEYKPKDAFERMKSWYKLKANNSTWFHDGIYKGCYNFQTLLDMNVKYVVDERDREGRRIYMVELGNIDTSTSTCAQLGELDDAWIENYIDEPEMLDKGLCIVLDMAGYSWKMFAWLTPHNVRVSTQKAELGPIKRINYHVVNSSKLLNAALAIVLPFLSAKTKEHIHFHYSNWPSLHEHIDPANLPTKYGGTGKDFDPTMLTKAVFYRDSVKENH